ncbi:MAG: hypothetical protein ACXVA9_03295 [Bdellovibrionales bacterium]
MMDIFFFIKTFILTIAIVLVMQIQVGDRTLETHAMGWVQGSGVGSPLGDVARGASKMTHDLSRKITESIHNNVSKNKKEDTRIKRESSFRWLHSSKDTKSKEE